MSTKAERTERRIQRLEKIASIAAELVQDASVERLGLCAVDAKKLNALRDAICGARQHLTLAA